jgi:DNA-binding beta-propeller fold protein YncE
MDTPEMTLGTVPAENAPKADPGTTEPPAPAEEEPASRRKKALLLLLVGLLAMVSLISIWYLLFRKPVTEIPLPVVPAAMPTYQGSLYDLSKPQAVAVSADGSRVFITQTGTSLDTVMMDLSGRQLGVLQPPADLIAQAHQLFVAVDPVTGDVWATDRFNGAVVVYSATGMYQRIFDQGVARANWQPLGIGFDKAGDLYVADVADSPTVIDVFGPDGTFLRSFGAGSSLNHPNGIAVAADGTVYVTDTGNGRLVVFDASGSQIGSVGRGVAVGNLGLPVGVAIDDHGRVQVVDSSAAMVQVYAPIEAGALGPAYMDSYGENGTGDGQLSFPNGLAADSRGRLFVADWGNDRLEVWSY